MRTALWTLPNTFLVSLAIGTLGMGSEGYAHQGHSHGHAPPAAESKGTDVKKAMLSKINESYLKSVKPIFQRSCFDCHSSQTKYPWYYKLPIAKQLIDHDVAESKEHLDLTRDFPFQGHGTVEEDLKALHDAISDGSMPPFRYRILHSGSAPNAEEKKLILDWIAESQKLLHEH